MAGTANHESTEAFAGLEYTVILSLAVKCLSVYSRTLNIPIRYPEQLLLVIDANSMFLSFSPITYSRLSLRCWKY